MISPGVKSLGDFTITGAGTQVGEWVEDLEGMLSMGAHLRLAFGSGGTNIKAYLQTSFDDGLTVADIACVVFGVASEAELLNFSALTPKGQVTPTDGTLADDTVVDGILGDRVRLKIISAGTYAGGTVLSGRINAR